jgi:hypothetical protein
MGKDPMRGPADRSRINIRDTWELEYWCKQFDVGPEKLKRAVVLAGVMLTDVKRYFGK